MSIIKNITIDQNSTFSLSYDIVGVNGGRYDLTDFVARATMKKVPTSLTTAGTFTTSIPQPTNGVVFISMTDEETAAIKAGRYYYDIVVENTVTGEKYRAVEGIVTVTPSITT